VTHQEALDTLASERYLLNEMSEKDRDAFEEHFFDCHVCADDLRVGAAMLQGARAGFAGTATPGRVFSMAAKRPGRTLMNPVWYRSVALPWAAAATLAVVAGYQALFVVPALRRDSSPVALAPVTLRPESRGAEPVVTKDASGSPVSLAVEIADPPQGGEITYDLSDANGRRIVSGRAAAPAPGTPLLLLLPSWTVVGPMHYILTVHDAAPAGRSLGEYRFAVSTH
jgi:hypothetical protein